MKKTIFTILIIVTVFSFFTCCEKLSDFGNTNTNPDRTTDPLTSALLTNVLSNLGKYSDSYPDFESWAALYCQFFSETYFTHWSCYDNPNRSPMNYYSSDLYDLQNIININSDDATKAKVVDYGANENQIAIARILKAYIYWTITDRWGDIPYTDALKDIPDVTFDPQEDIYKDLLEELADAVAQFTSGQAIKGDFVYDGDITKWKKFANSLRMLISIRLSKRYPLPTDYAANQFQLALDDAAGSIETNDDNFVYNFEGGIFRNPYYVMYDGGEFTGESATITDLLQSLNNDQRQDVFGSAADGTPSTLGVPYGVEDSYIAEWRQANSMWCRIFHPDYREQNDPIYIITASHVLLARTEAADRGWTSETASTTSLYQDGITQSFLQWGLDPPDNTYFASPNVSLSEIPGTGANLEKIAIQQYVAFYPDGTQGWSNWRRTDYPALSPAPNAFNSPKVIPRRYVYGKEDYALAGKGVLEAVARLEGGDRMDSRVWWDKEE